MKTRIVKKIARVSVVPAKKGPHCQGGGDW